MARRCSICGKETTKANTIVRRGKAKKKGGVGKKTTGISRRRQKPNLKKIKALVNGSTKRIKVCTNCIKSQRVKRAY